MESIYPAAPEARTDAELDRAARLDTACLAAFGDNPPPPLGGRALRPSNEFGKRITPRQYAAGSDAALAEVLAPVKTLSEGETPVWDPRPGRGRRRVFKARKR